MTKVAITTSNHVVIDGVQTDYRVIQRHNQTVVYKGQVPYGTEIVGIMLPNAQYDLSRNDGRNQFYADFIAATAA